MEIHGKSSVVDDGSNSKEGSGINCEPNDQSQLIDRCQLFNGLLKDFHFVKEKLSKIPLNNPTTSTAEETSSSSHIPKSTNESPAAVASAFEKLDLAAQEKEGEADFEIVEKDKDREDEDEDDMVVVKESEEEKEDYVGV